MTMRTRYFAIASLLVLGLGLGTGLVAYYRGFQGALSSPGGPSELQFIPRSASIVAFANVQDVMVSEVRRRLRDASPLESDGQREFEKQTGIVIETDIDRVVATLAPSSADDSVPSVGLLLARGRFDEVKIEGVMREHGARVDTYKGKRLIIADQARRLYRPEADPSAGGASPSAPDGSAPLPPRGDLSLAFLEPGLAAVGSTELVRHAIDLKDGGENVTANGEMMRLVQSLEDGNVWAVGRFDALSAQARVPAGVAKQLPPITWFSVAGHVNGGIRATLRVEARDDQSATDLRAVVRGFASLGSLQAASSPALQMLMRSLVIGGSGTTVSLSFDAPAELFDRLGKDLPTAPGVPR